MTAKIGVFLALTLIGVALVYQLTTRLSDQAIDVAVGVLCGIAASVPVSLGLLLALTRRRAQDSNSYDDEPVSYPEPVTPYHPPAPPRQPYPPIIVVTPPQNQSLNPYNTLLPPGSLPSGYNMQEPPSTRDFRIIGEDDDTFEG